MILSIAKKLKSTKDDDNAESYQSLLSEYEGYDYEYKIYTIDLDDALNKGSLADESSFEDDIKFKGNTLLKIEDKKVTDVYESEDSITDKLNELIDSLKNED